MEVDNNGKEGKQTIMQKKGKLKIIQEMGKQTIKPKKKEIDKKSIKKIDNNEMKK